MNNNDLQTPAGLFARLGNLLDNINTSELKKANVRYFFSSIGFTVLMMWLFGLNIWTLLGALFLQSVYFFGLKTATRMYKLTLAGIVMILVGGFIYNVFIEKTGLSDDFFSFTKDGVMKRGVDLENPAIDLQARYKGLTREEAKKLLEENYNSPEGLLKAIDSLKKRENLLYNSLHGKKFEETKPQPSASSPTITTNNQSMRQSGDTTYYNFTLEANEVSPQINLIDQNGKNYDYNLVRSDNVIVIGSNGKQQVWDMSHHNFWDSKFHFQGIPGHTPINIFIKVFPANN